METDQQDPVKHNSDDSKSVENQDWFNLIDEKAWILVFQTLKNPHHIFNLAKVCKTTKIAATKSLIWHKKVLAVKRVFKTKLKDIDNFKKQCPVYCIEYEGTDRKNLISAADVRTLPALFEDNLILLFTKDKDFIKVWTSAYESYRIMTQAYNTYKPSQTLERLGLQLEKAKILEMEELKKLAIETPDSNSSNINTDTNTNNNNC